MEWTIIICLASLAVIAGLFIEKAHMQASRQKLQYIIHVNGIRGKSTTTRLIAAGLRACGISTACKTTGTVPVYSGPDGIEHTVIRLGPANIREQKRILHRAVRDKATVLVIECMAVSPEMQAICEHNILHADICVMTKILPDHTDLLGESESQIALSLANTIPYKGTVITLPDNYDNVFSNVAADLQASVVVSSSVPVCGVQSIDRFPENLQLACAVAKHLDLPMELFLEGVRNYSPDPFSFEAIKIGKMTFYNAFSANDPASIMKLYHQCCTECGDIQPTVLLNTRGDRPERAIQHIDMLVEMRPKKILLMGDGTLSMIHKLRNKGIYPEELLSFDAILEESYVFACGNIQGNGQKLIRYLKEEKGKNG